MLELDRILLSGNTQLYFMIDEVITHCPVRTRYEWIFRNIAPNISIIMDTFYNIMYHFLSVWAEWD